MLLPKLKQLPERLLQLETVRQKLLAQVHGCKSECPSAVASTIFCLHTSELISDTDVFWCCSTMQLWSGWMCW